MTEYLTTNGETLKVTVPDPAENFCAFVKCRVIIENKEVMTARAELMRDLIEVEDMDDLDIYCEKSDQYRSNLYQQYITQQGSFLDLLGVIVLSAEAEDWKTEIMYDLGIKENHALIS